MASSSSSSCCSSLISLSFLIAVAVFFLLPSSASSSDPEPDHNLVYHGGPLLTGKINLSILWYGSFGRLHKSVLRSFIRSLNTNSNPNLEPPVSSWWETVESYQEAAETDEMEQKPKIGVKIAKEVTDRSYSIGKVVTNDFLPGFAKEVTKGRNDTTVVVIFTARDVTVQGLCMGKCADHGVIEVDESNQLYIIVGNLETECPGVCAWPFHKADYGPQGVTLQPPNGKVGADAMIISFAQALAATVTNPYNNGFYDGPENDRVEASTACPGIFASGAFPGYTGKVRVDPTNGGAFNAYGTKGKKFLLPALWNPKTSSCWTTI